MIKIQSISDIITNSSSEVFVVKTNKHAEVAKLLEDICDVLGIKIHEIIEFVSATEHGKDHDFGFKWNKGDLLIYSADENSIPYPLMQLIENLNWFGINSKVDALNIKDIKRHHLG